MSSMMPSIQLTESSDVALSPTPEDLLVQQEVGDDGSEAFCAPDDHSKAREDDLEMEGKTGLRVTETTPRTLSLPNTGFGGDDRRKSSMIIAGIEQMAHMLASNPLLNGTIKGRNVALLVLMAMVSLIGTGTTVFKGLDTSTGGSRGAQLLEAIYVHIGVEVWSPPKNNYTRVAHFSEMDVQSQFAPFSLNIILLLITITLLICGIVHAPVGRIVVCVYAFTGVPIQLMTFAMQLYYCKCPWIDDYYAKTLIGYRPQFRPNNMHTPPQESAMIMSGGMSDLDSQPFCVVYSWAAAAALSLLSAALLIADGIAACFDKSVTSQETEVILANAV